MGKINVKYEEDTALVSVNSKRKVDKFLLELIIRELKLATKELQQIYKDTKQYEILYANARLLGLTDFIETEKEIIYGTK